MSIATNTLTMNLKQVLSAKNIADAALILAILVYAVMYATLALGAKSLDFLEMIAVLIYALWGTLAFSVISFIARGIYLYKNSAARNTAQKILIFIAAIPSFGLLLKTLFF